MSEKCKTCVHQGLYEKVKIMVRAHSPYYWDIPCLRCCELNPPTSEYVAVHSGSDSEVNKCKD